MDDCEIGAGGLIAKSVKKGHRVVLVNCASDYSTWQTTQGREKEIRERLLKQAQEIGVEKKFLGYGYQAIPDDLDAIKKLAEVVLDVRPDLTVFHNRYEPSPSDHATVGYIAERAVRDATRLLNRYPSFSQEMYAFEVYPRISQFQPDVFLDISDVIGEVVQWPAVADRIYAESPHSKRPISDWIVATIKLGPDKETEIPLWTHGHMKYVTAAFRGQQCGARYAEAYMSLDKRPVGRGVLLEIAS
jgi:hypothetical protein